MAAIQHFILMYDRARGRLIDVQDFGSDSKAAVARYSEIERQHQGNEDMDIVLVGSDSLETVKLTHANYFNEQVGDSRYADSIARYLTGA